MHSRWLISPVAGLVLGAMWMGGQSSGVAPVRQEEPADSSLARRRTPIVEVFEAARDAVVNISSTEIVRVRRPFGFDSIFEDFFDMPSRSRERQYKRTSVGSGFVVHPGGYIVTNAHVVAGTVERKVTFADGQEYEADIVAIDTSRDLAVLKIDAPTSLPTLRLGRSDDLMQGETVIAIGNPLGYQHTITAGVVSAVGRDLAINRDLKLSGLIQTDASINPGNSGGPLLNVLGELIGVNTAIRGDAQNIGFAIPVDQLCETLPDLLDVERRYRFITGLSVGHDGTPRVTAVEPDSPAAKIPIHVGDRITSVDGQPVRDGVDYHIALIGRHAGEKVPLTFEHDGSLTTRTLALAPRPAPDGKKLADERLGIEVYPIPEDVAKRIGLRRTTGLLIVGVESDSPAAELGLQRRDVLEAVGRRSVSTVEELGQILERADAGDELEITILRVDRGAKYRLSGRIEVR